MSEAKIYNVLFICTANSARSIMAEGLLNFMGRGRFKAHSAGSQPAGQVSPLALATLERLRIPGSGYRSKDWTEFSGSDAPKLDFVLTVCDKAAGEVCPVWPGQPMTAHWGVADPVAVEGSNEEKARAFSSAATVLKRRIELMLAVPIEKLDKLALKKAIADIGNR